MIHATQALVLQPKYEKALCRRAICFEAVGKIQQALLDYRYLERITKTPDDSFLIQKVCLVCLQPVLG